MLYRAKFYGGGFGRVYEPKTPVIKLCTVQHYLIIFDIRPHNRNAFIDYDIVPNQVDKNARRIIWSKSLHGALFKPRRSQLVSVLLYKRVHHAEETAAHNVDI